MSNTLPIPISSTISERDSWSSWRELMLCSTAKARELLTFSQAEQFDLLPLGVHLSKFGDAILTVAVASELDPEVLRSLSFIANAKIVGIKALPHLVSQARFAAYSRREFSKVKLKDSVPAILRELIQTASAESASDIHLELAREKLRVRFRIDGLLRDRAPQELCQANFKDLCRHIQVLCKLDSTFQRKPLEGSFTVSFGKILVRVRASLFLQSDGGRVVLRLLDSTPKVLSNSSRRGDLQSLGMSPLQEQVMRGFLGMSSGTIILAGPTGSGKSTLLYEALSYAQNSERCVVTLEDPIERFIDGVSQTEINREQGLDYQDYLKPLLRQDPDVIMVGEIRDAQTAQMALEAGITGHLVLTTIHARTVIDVLIRLAEFGLSRELISLSLSHIIAQRLVPTNCASCRESQAIPARLAEYFRIDKDAQCCVSRGCEACENSGIDGRIGVFETLTVGEIVKEFLLQSDRSSYPQLLKELSRLGITGLYTSRVGAARQHLLSGRVSPVFALQALDIAPELFGFNNNRGECAPKS